MTAPLHRLHRYLSLGIATLWLVQALTGIVMVFHWELDDALVASPSVPVDIDAVSRKVVALDRRAPPEKVTSFYPTGGSADRFDVYIKTASGDTDVERINGAGQTVIRRPIEHDYAHAGWVSTAVELHQSLFAGDLGRGLIGLSGILLLSNLGLGLALAWPRKGQWRRTLLPAQRIPRGAALYVWHRTVGLWLCVPAAVLIAAGVLLAFDDSLEHALLGDVVPPALAQAPRFDSKTGSSVTPAQAIRAGQQLYPGAFLSGVRMPSEDAAWYRVRLRQPGEPQRVFGTTTVYVSSVTGNVLLNEDAFKNPAARRFLDVLYPTHTGEVGGIVGRFIALGIAVWLLSMLVLGFSLWRSRINRRSASH